MKIRLSARTALSAAGAGWLTLVAPISALKHWVAETPLGRSPQLRLIARVAKKTGEDDSSHMAASVSYYAMLSMFPLIIAVSAIIGWIAGSETRQDELVGFVVDFVPGSERFVRDSIDGAERFRETFGAIAILGLIWSGSAVFGSINRIVNRAWEVTGKPPFFKNKPRQLAMALGVGILFFLSIGFTGFLQWATTIEIGSRSASEMVGGDFFAILLRIPAALITFLIFLSIYKFLPNTKTFYRHVWLGAIVATLLFEISKNLFLYYLEAFAVFDQLYGNVASVIVLMLWTYLCSMVLIFGAEISAEYSRTANGDSP